MEEMSLPVVADIRIWRSQGGQYSTVTVIDKNN